MKKCNNFSALFFITTGIFSYQAVANDSMFSVMMDDPSSVKKTFEGDVSAGYEGQNGNTRNTKFTGGFNSTWYNSHMAYSMWGNATNKTTDEARTSETYLIGSRSRYNLTKKDYLFGQLSWLSDRYNGYAGRTLLTAGYGRQILSGSVHSLRAELGPAGRYDVFQQKGQDTRALLYTGIDYQWKLSDQTSFIQSVSVVAAKNKRTTVGSETGLNVAITDKCSLKLTYDVTWNETPPASAPIRTDSKTTVQFSYLL